MADYRDDRGALRQRVEELESELQRARRANTELQAELEQTRERASPRVMIKGVGKPPLPAVLVFLGVVAAAFVAILVQQRSHPLAKDEPEEASEEPARPPELTDWGDPSDPPPRSPTAEPTPPPPPAFVHSQTCRCDGAGPRSTLAYRTIRTPTREGVDKSVVEASLVGARTVELRLMSETAPPDSLASKRTRLLLACDARQMVLAFGTRVTAWDRATGDAMWMATLPDRVGSVEPGPFGIECTKLPVTEGAISLKHDNGTTLLSMADGEPVTASAR